MSTPCQADPELWFSNDQNDIEDAKQACLRCPQLIACTKLAGELQPEYGVWAGLAPSERGKGRYTFGRRIVTPTDVAAANQMHSRGFTLVQAASELGVSYQALLKARARAAA